jgi:CHRD domain
MKKLSLALSMVALVATGCGDDDDAGSVDGGAADSAAATTYTVPLTSAEEIPLCGAAGAAAAGEATVTISADNTTVSVEASWDGLSGDATAAHIHYGALGIGGGVIFLLGMPPGNPVTGTFTAADYPNPIPDGAPADFAAFVTAMKAGTSYVNVHTDACMPGEIRGQID